MAIDERDRPIYINLKDGLPDISTADLPDEVVNQRLIITTLTSAHDPRTPRGGAFGAAFWLDDGGPDEKWFTIGPEGYRGVLSGGFIKGGPGLSADERRYAAAHLIAIAKVLLALDDEVPA